MPSIIEKMKKQKCVFWAYSGSNRHGSSQTYAEPVLMRCRWEDVSEEFKTSTGETVVSQSRVFLSEGADDAALVVKGAVMLVPTATTSLDELTTLDRVNPLRNKGAWTIRGFSKVPDLKAKNFLRIAML